MSVKNYIVVFVRAAAFAFLMGATLGAAKGNDPLMPAFVEVGKTYFVSLTAQPDAVRGMVVEILSSSGGGWFRVKAAWVHSGNTPSPESEELWINFANVVTAQEWKPNAEGAQIGTSSPADGRAGRLALSRSWLRP